MKTKRSTLLLFIMMLVVSMFLAACAGGGDNASDGGDGNKDEGNKQDEGTTDGGSEGGDLVLAVLSDASSLDPHGSNDVPSSAVQENIFETLVKRNDNNEIEPGLATEWEAIDDTTWEFKLQEGVKFHDGEDFNAEAVKKSFERVLDEKVASPRYFLFEMINSVEVIDDYTVQFKTDYPFAPLLAHMSHNGGSIISPKSIDEDYAAMEDGKEPGSVISENPVGTGYFKFDSWSPGSEIKLVKNEDYWNGPAKVDSVAFKVVPESATRAAELETGNAHIIDPVQPNEVARINDSGNATVDQTPSSSLSYIGFNTEKAPFDDVRVRKAISMAVNKEDIIDGVYEGFGIPAKGPLAPGIFGYDEKLKMIDYNMDEAKKLLEEAGYADGFSTTIWTNDNPQRVDMAVLLQQSLKELNIDVKIEQMEFGTYLEKTAAGEHDMFILGWSNPTGDADYGLYALFHSSQKGDPGNRSFYENEKVDQLLDEGRKETDPDARVGIYAEAQQQIVEDAPMIFIHHQEYLNGVSDKVKGFSIDQAGIYKLKDVTLSE
ncbi:glutathione ABC transporter substrate-binding protein [Edaphobacillus lindanitolerans]|uniref:Peptide/nickel transport system substrate-binding protein n=1 Tax=Edaphobacillus lindanitolerans TaxID=550447 RepID=A0A1U7PRT7_9BACI|nr:glutathione ABC transporter substrate-binding protein [Edaphobacillus lindanitolerans]SIT88992.1 peptide/nickel transport system substrate-binding protein [Edaphobacillus lindanitolerans]